MNESIQGKEIPSSCNEAAITLIHKQGLDETDLYNYRPISLLNIDYKVYAGILANKLKVSVTEYIQEDQVGFLHNRHLKDNIRVLINVIEFYDKNPGKQAFDNLNWEFLITLLEVNFGDKFIDAIRGIYRNQRSNLIVNGERTDDFSLKKST